MVNSQVRADERQKMREMVEAHIQIPHKNQRHICGFNDGEQTCDCYNEALDDIINSLK